MSMTRFTCLPVRVVCFGISGTEALGGDTACWASADIAVTIAAAMPASNTIVVFIEFSCYENRDDDYESGRYVVKRSRQLLREESGYASSLRAMTSKYSYGIRTAPSGAPRFQRAMN